MKKKILALILSFTLITIIPLFGVAVAEVVEPNAPIYYHFENAYSVVSDGNAFLVGDDKGLHLIENREGQFVNLENTSVTELCGSPKDAYALCGGEIIRVTFNDNGSASENIGISGAEHITLFNGELYYSRGNTIYDDNGDAFLTAPSEILSMASADKLYYATANGNRFDIYDDGGGVVFPLIKSSRIFGGDGLYSVKPSGELTRITEEGELSVLTNAFVTSAYGYGNGICVTTDEGEILNIQQGKITLVAASASSEDGFYHHPLYATTRLGNLYVCDYLNNRVAIKNLQHDSLDYITLYRPQSLAVASDGTLYVVHSSKRISVYSFELEFLISYTFEHNVSQVCVDANGDVYALSNECVFKLEDTGFVNTLLTATSIHADGGLFSVKEDGRVYKNDDLVLSKTGIVDITTDASGKIFALINDGSSISIVRFDGQTATTIDTEFSLDGATSISVSKCDVGTINFGDVIIADKLTHKIISVSSSVSGSASENITPPDEADYDENIIRTTLRPCSLFGSLNESNVELSLAKNKSIIVLKYDATTSFAYCASEDLTGNLVYGFVFRSALSDALEYRTPPADEGTIYTENTFLFSLPSLSAPTVKTNGADGDSDVSFDRGDKVELLDFADYSSGKTRWYKVNFNETTGYVPSNSVSIRNFIPGDARPQYNAKIISYKGSTHAPVYLINSEGEYEQILGDYLKTGTQVEILDSFDESEKYAEIKYFDENLGTLTCFVEIVYLEYNSITLLQTIAIIVAILTFVLLVFLLVRLYMKNRKL